ncbi:RNA recognition motif family protein [Theileria parva strain Muguga]|uniref:RNA recognition motif family protein n=1 Tax=Theileria parva strain Muguga TaxID=333668 RepID=UPI001C623ACD|nr:RNA recognition motif family protein [Theileria parva strain Muguga]EAN34117.2 RNA recognition motif family protein [Theileria parva strain Muguga]
MVETTESSDTKNFYNASPLLTESDYESLKIFAGGLTRSTTPEDLKAYFSKFGEVTHTEIVRDKNSGRSRGFGFVTFAERESVNTVLRKSHTIDGVEADVKLAVRKEKAKILAPQYDQTKRIFVGGVSEKITESYFRDYFARYGPIASYNYLVDRATNRPRGYGFVIYENMEDAEKSVGLHMSLGRNCEAKFAQPKNSEKEETMINDFDYSAYYYAQANLLYSQYLSQMYNGQTTTESSNTDEYPTTNRSRESSPYHKRDRSYDRKRSRRSRSRSRSRSRHRSRSRSYSRRRYRR